MLLRLVYLAILPSTIGGMPSPEVEHYFRSEHFRYSVGSSTEATYNYRLFVPKLVGKASAPLVVWLHGYGNDEFVLENRGQLLHTQFVFPTPNDCERQKFFLLALQCPDPPGHWYSEPGLPQPEEPLTALKALIEQVTAKYPIDRDRISLLGISGGGTSAWEMAIRYPELFAAIAPLGSNGSNNPKLECLTRIPIWAFHATGDHPERVRDSVTRVNAAGGSAYLTEILLDQHDCWTKALTEYNLVPWLVAQRRGGWGWWPAGYGNPWQLGAQVGIPLLLVFACIKEIRRKRRSAR